MSELLFAYGTLNHPEIQQKLIGRVLDGTPDELEGYTTTQIRINDQIFPMLVDAASERVRGRVYAILKSDLPPLDEYEGEAYKRVKVQLKSGKETWVYKKNE